MKIRLMTGKDVWTVATLEKKIFTVPWTLKDFEGCAASPLCRYLVAEDGDGGIVGYAGFRQVLDEADIENLAVEPNCRRQGIARQLLAALLEEGYARGVRTFFLEVRDSNLPAIRLYESFGFEQIAVREDYYRKPCEDARIYRLTRR